MQIMFLVKRMDIKTISLGGAPPNTHTHTCACMRARADAHMHTTGEVNISIGCDGAAKNAGLKDDEMVVGIPEEQLEDISNILAEKAGAWNDWMRS